MTLYRTIPIVLMTLVFFSCEYEELNPTNPGTMPVTIADTVRFELSLTNDAGEETLIFRKDSSIHVSYSIENGTQDSLMFWCYSAQSFFPSNSIWLLPYSDSIRIDVIGTLPYFENTFMPPGDNWLFESTISSPDTGRYKLGANTSFYLDESIVEYDYIFNGNWDALIHIVE